MPNTITLPYDAQNIDSLQSELEQVLRSIEALNDTAKNVSRNSRIQLTTGISNDCQRFSQRTMKELHTLQMRLRNLAHH